MLNVDIDNLEKTVKPILKNNRKNLDKAKDNLTSIVIPSDFLYASKLKNLPNNIADIKRIIYHDIEKWIDDCIKNFRSAENLNKKLANSIMYGSKSVSVKKTNANIYKTKNIQDTEKTKVEKVVSRTKSTVLNAFDYVVGGDWLIDAADVAKSTATKVVNGVTSTATIAIDTGAKVGKKITSKVSNAVTSTLDYLGDKVSSAWDWVSDNLKSTAASVTNVFIALTKGVCNVVESLTDFLVLLGTAELSVVTGARDGVTYLYSKYKGNTDDWSSATVKMWKNSMAYVAEDYVENVYQKFYMETAVGRWLDDNAYKWFKSDGVGSKVASGIGYVAGIIGMSVVTGGLLGATSLVGAGSSVATTAGVGKYTAEYWQEARDSSWEGIERMLEKGEISKEQYESYKAIKSLTDKEWKEIQDDYKNGNISEEEFTMIKQIREMPEDWTTLNNGIKGITYGTVNGLWEGIQWYVGGKLAGATVGGVSEGINSAIRIGADTGFNALDTPFRTIVEALITGKDLDQAWLEQGGWQSVLTNIGVGLIGSVGGEIGNIKAENIKAENIKAENIKAENIKAENIKAENIIDSKHGFQLNMDDFGLFYKTKLKNGFFTEKQINNILERVNTTGFIDENTGKFLKELFNNEDSNIFIKTIHSSDMDSIMNEGIRCLGTSTSGCNSGSLDISSISLENIITDVTPDGLFGLVQRLKQSNGLSQGNNPINGAVILKIPKGIAEENILKYNSELGLYNIDPKYNVGFVGCDAKGVLDGTELLKKLVKKETVNVKEVNNVIKESAETIKNEMNLKNEVLSKTNGIEDEILIAKTLYEEVNKKVHYDFECKYGGDIKRQQILNSKTSFDNLNSNSKVVCKGWSELYVELLKEKGIDCEVVKATDIEHWWVQINTKDGRTIVADATDVIGGKVDLVNSKIGSQTNGFFEINKNQIGQRPQSIIKTSEQVDQIFEIDKKLGYADKDGYRFNKTNDVKKVFKSNIFKKDKNNLKFLEIPDGIDGYEAYGYYKQLQEINKDIYTSLVMIKNGNSVEPLCSVSIVNSKQSVFQIYGETIGKRTFSNVQDMNKYMETLNIIK